MRKNIRSQKREGIIALLLVLAISSCTSGNDDEDEPVPMGADAITIHENNRVASLLMSSGDYEAWKSSRGASQRELTKNVVYEKFKDDFDFIAMILNEDEKPENWSSGSLSPIINQVQGIGTQLFDRSADYGSSSKLRGILNLPVITFLEKGPSLHEILHTWANYGIETEWIDGRSLTHWGVSGGSTPGQLGGFKQGSLKINGVDTDFEVNGRRPMYLVDQFNPVANGGNGVPYNEMELYLMGLIPVSEVTSFDVFTGISGAIKDQGEGIVVFDAGGRVTYTSEMIVQELGERVPSVADAQKAFKMLMLILTDRSLTNEQWNMLDTQAELFEKDGDNDVFNNFNFWEATRGKATMELGSLQNSVK